VLRTEFSDGSSEVVFVAGTVVAHNPFDARDSVLTKETSRSVKEGGASRSSLVGK
jgi:hypothetical protein